MPPLMALMAPEEPLHEDAQVAYLVGKQPDQAGVWRELYVYRARRMVHVYRIESHGRRFYRSLEYCSDARYCLRDMQPSTAHREGMWPEWERHGAGHPYGDSHNQTKSAVITRDWMVEANLSLGRETYLPSRLLYGLVPQALLDTHAFWQDEDDHVRGSPRGMAQGWTAPRRMQVFTTARVRPSLPIGARLPTGRVELLEHPPHPALRGRSRRLPRRSLRSRAPGDHAEPVIASECEVFLLALNGP